MRILTLVALLAVSVSLMGCTAETRWQRIDSDHLAPPPLPREMRGVWVATVANIDWPSEPGLSVEQQLAEADRTLDLAAKLGLNAIILQVRPHTDALYAGAMEPWSSYLTGRQGVDPGYDPLAYWISGAHERGLE
ncbi:MAG: family 10 glycosylhydrolase, partial [Planctomycetota bacterium]